MTSETPGFKKLFTVDQANNMLPLVRAIVADLQRLYLELFERQRRLDHLTTGRDEDADDLYSDELRAMDAQMEHDRTRLSEYMAELRELGVECKDPGQGLVDFPAEMDGKVVFLCWKLDEPEVLHWHEIDAGFAGRRPLTAGAISAGEADDFGANSEND